MTRVLQHINSRYAYIPATVIICAFVKRFCKSFLRRNGLQNRFTADSESADYAGGQYITKNQRFSETEFLEETQFLKLYA